MLLYPFYVNNFTVASATLKKVKANNPEFAEFVRQRERRSEMKLQDVESLLLMPVQRIPQYTLLLQVRTNHQRAFEATRHDTTRHDTTLNARHMPLINSNML